MTTSRITSTNSGQYDQIFALPQSYLNMSFVTLWAIPSHGLQDLVVDNWKGSIKAKLGPPEVIMDVDPQGGFVNFNMNFSTGTITLRDDETGDPLEPKTLDGCTFSFKVSIGGEVIGGMDPAYKRIINERLHYDAGNYSISRLYMDLTTTNISNLDIDHSKLPSDLEHTDWTDFVQAWMRIFSKNQANTLGYSITTPTPDNGAAQVLPTFTPTFNQFQTGEWRSPNGAKAGKGIPSGNFNQLLYLQVTDNTPIPDTDKRAYSYTGNLVDDGKAGTLLISRKLFWDKWLLPQLQVLNWDCELVTTDAHCSGNELAPNFRATVAVGPHASDPNRDMNNYGWTAKAGADSGSYGYTWAPNVSTITDSGGIWGSALNTYVNSTTRNEITFVPGGNAISVKGNLHCKVHQWTDAGGEAEAEVDCNWSFDLVMEQTIVDADGNALGGVPGGITTYLRNIQKGEPTCVTSSKWGTNPPPEGISETIKAGIEALNIAAIAQTIEKGLSGAGSFVLPGNGSFDMTEPILNNNGDWLCKLTYKDSELKKTGTPN